jgi:hypothetical protein
MDLSNPAALWLLLLLLPLLFASRHRPRSARPVATLHFWHAAQGQTPLLRPSLRRDYTALLVQSLFVLLVVAALAAPMLDSDGRRVAIVVDVSASMGARSGATNRLTAAKAQAAALVATLPRATRVQLIAAHAIPEAVGEFTVPDGALAAAIQALAATDTGAALDRAIGRARALQPAAIYVFSDVAPPADVRNPTSLLRWTSAGDPADNVAITNLSLGSRSRARDDIDVLVSLRNYGATGVETAVVLEQDGALVGRDAVEMAPMSGADLVMTVRNAAGVVTARLDADDALAADNTRRLLVPEPSIRVRLLSASYFVEQALSVHPRVSIVTREPFDLVVCDGCPALPAEDASILIFPPRTADSASSPVPLTGPAGIHPVTRSVSLDGVLASPLESAVEVGQGSEILVRAGERPVVLAYTSRARSVLDVRLDPSAAGFPTTPAFPILLANAVEWLARRDEAAGTVVAGEPFTWTLSAHESSSTPVVTGPTGRPVPSTLTGRSLTVPLLRRAGVYHVRSGSGEWPFVVNPATAAESDLTGQTAAAAADVALQDPGVANPRRHLSPLLLIAALALLAVEFHRRYGRVNGPSGSVT